MDRRMYRGTMGRENGYRRGTSPYRASEPMHHDGVCGYTPEDSCEREKYEDIDRFPLAMCYVPWQCFRNLYENEFVALANGTLFKELDLKWYGRGCK